MKRFVLGCTLVGVIMTLVGFASLFGISAWDDPPAPRRTPAPPPTRTLPTIKQELAAAIAAGQWGQATALYAEGSSHSPSDTELATHKPVIDEGSAREEESLRRAAVLDGIADAKGVTAATECTEPPAILRAWSKLKRARDTDPEWREAQRLTAALESCRLKAERISIAGATILQAEERAAMARRLELDAVENGMNFDVVTGGKTKDKLTFRWALMSKVTVHKMTDGGSMADGSLLSNLQRAGFRKVTFEDGYNYEVYYPLTPPLDPEFGKLSAGLGLREPLRLE